MGVTPVQRTQDRLTELYRLRSQVDQEIRAVEDALVRLATARQKAIEAGIRYRKRHRLIAQCGTDGGYYRHRRTLREPACEECKAAHRIAEAMRARRRQERQSA